MPAPARVRLRTYLDRSVAAQAAAYPLRRSCPPAAAQRAARRARSCCDEVAFETVQQWCCNE
eukprot:gene34596-11070_t